MINQVDRSLINARAGALFSQRSIFARSLRTMMCLIKRKRSGLVTGSAAPLTTPHKRGRTVRAAGVYGIIRKTRELSRSYICTHSRHFCLNTLQDGQNILLIREEERKG